MARKNDDRWSITQTVGTSALGVAVARAAASAQRDPAIDDPYAAIFLDALPTTAWQQMAHLAADDRVLARIDSALPQSVHALVDYIAARTLFLDDLFMISTAAGITQVVILGSGLDARPWRLHWPETTTIYDIDQPAVLDFKAAALADHQTKDNAHVWVGIDLRDDWATALAAAGFDPTASTAWSAEGLLSFLSFDDQTALFERVTQMSAPTSRMAIEAPSPDAALDATHLSRFRAAAATLISVPLPDAGDLWFAQEPPTRTIDTVQDLGWTTAICTAQDVMRHHGRQLQNPTLTPANPLIEARLA